MTHQKWLRPKLDKEIEKLQNNFFTLSDAVEFWYKKESVGLHQGFSFKDSLNVLYIFPEKMRGTWSRFMCLFVFHPLIITIKKERKMRLCKHIIFPGQDSFVYHIQHLIYWNLFYQFLPLKHYIFLVDVFKFECEWCHVPLSW